MIPQKASTALIVALTVAAVSLTFTVAGLLSANQVVPFSGTINAVNVGVYTDAACTQNATSLTVGNINPGATANQTVYVKNTGNVPETLTMAVSNWNPTSASTYLTLTWNRQNYVLAAGASVQATLTLTAAANTGTLTTFSCSVTITGTQ